MQDTENTIQLEQKYICGKRNPSYRIQAPVKIVLRGMQITNLATSNSSVGTSPGDARCPGSVGSRILAIRAFTWNRRRSGIEARPTALQMNTR